MPIELLQAVPSDKNQLDTINILEYVLLTIGFFHTRLLKNIGTINLISKKFNINAVSIEKFGLAYFDLNNVPMPTNQESINRLVKTEFIKEIETRKKTEYHIGHNDSIVIPITNNQNLLTSLVVFNMIHKPIVIRHYAYLEDYAFLNESCFKNNETIILTTSLYNFFTAHQDGLENIVPILTPRMSEHQCSKFTENKIKEIWIDFDPRQHKEIIRQLCILNIPVYKVERIQKIQKGERLILPRDSELFIPKRIASNPIFSSSYFSSIYYNLTTQKAMS